MAEDTLNWAQLRPAVVKPLHESRSDTEIIFDLAKRLGLSEQFFNGNIDTALNYQLAPSGISVQQLKEHPVGLRSNARTRHEKYIETDAQSGERRGFDTPTGVFTILEKNKEHISRKFNDAPMPYQQRLTWGGVALHAGGLPGYPESHGCIHLPTEFAQRLFDISPNGMTVVIGTDATAPERVAHPGYLAPVKFVGGQPIEPQPFAPTEEERWQPELSPSGPVSIVLSQGSRRVVVYRNGIEIGRARLTVVGDAPLVNHALVLTEGPSTVPDPYVPDPTKFSWLRIGVPGHMGEQGTQVDPNAVARLKLPADFIARLNGLLTPGATLLVTNEALYPQTTGPMVQVVDADPPAKRQPVHPRG